MSTSSGTRRPDEPSDPRAVITPEAFTLAPELLGRPLAPPRHRLAAILVDLVLIGLLSRAGGLLLGIAAVVFLFRLASGGPADTALRTTFRVAVGCFGAIVLVVTSCTLFFAFGPEGVRDAAVDRIREEVAPANPDAPGLGEVFGGLSEADALRRAATPEEAGRAASALARRLERVGATRSDIREVLEELAGRAPWDGDPDALADETLAALDTLDAAASGAPDRATTVRGDTVGSGADSASATGDTSLTAALEPAADTISALEAALAEEREEREDAERTLERVRQSLEETRDGGGVFGFLENIVDDLGLAFGWGGLYMTIFMGWWNGQTPGKKLLGIRVVQLDNSPLTWWEAFERSGGYAAGFATGLLGFAQVYWDPNRQAIHDKISETVVVLESGPDESRTEAQGS